MLQGGPTTQVGRSPYRRRQTDHPTPGACRARRREPCQSKRTRNRTPSPQSDRGPRGPQAETPPAPGEAGATRNVVKRQARGAPRQSTAHSERGRGTRHARAAPPGQPAGARNRGRGPLHGTGEPGGPVRPARRQVGRTVGRGGCAAPPAGASVMSRGYADCGLRAWQPPPRVSSGCTRRVPCWTRSPACST